MEQLYTITGQYGNTSQPETIDQVQGTREEAYELYNEYGLAYGFGWDLKVLDANDNEV